jgi:DnaJ-class molecular chaperone
MDNPYDIIGVPRGSTSAEITEAYERLITDSCTKCDLSKDEQERFFEKITAVISF